MSFTKIYNNNFNDEFRVIKQKKFEKVSVLSEAQIYSFGTEGLPGTNFCVHTVTNIKKNIKMGLHNEAHIYSFSTEGLSGTNYRVQKVTK